MVPRQIRRQTLSVDGPKPDRRPRTAVYGLCLTAATELGENSAHLVIRQRRNQLDQLVAGLGHAASLVPHKHDGSSRTCCSSRAISRRASTYPQPKREPRRPTVAPGLTDGMVSRDPLN